jgi:hypothetical protein
MRLCDNPKCTLQDPKELWAFFHVYGITPDELYRATLANDPGGNMRKSNLIGFFDGYGGEVARVIISAFAHFVYENADNYRSTKDCVDHWLHLTAPEAKDEESPATETARHYRVGRLLEQDTPERMH